MKRMGLLGGMALVAALSSSGCCWWADHWCPQRNNYPAAYAPVGYPAPAASPYCQPCVPICNPTSGYASPPGGYPTTTWNRPGAGPCNP